MGDVDTSTEAVTAGVADLCELADIVDVMGGIGHTSMLTADALQRRTAALALRGAANVIAALVAERDEARAEVERLRAVLAASWLRLARAEMAAGGPRVIELGPEAPAAGTDGDAAFVPDGQF